MFGSTPTALVAVPPAAVLNFVVPPDPILLGFTVAIQGIDLLRQQVAGAFCGPPEFAQKFRTRDTLNLTFQ
jgi:hypothetical protein